MGCWTLLRHESNGAKCLVHLWVSVQFNEQTSISSVWCQYLSALKTRTRSAVTSPYCRYFINTTCSTADTHLLFKQPTTWCRKSFPVFLNIVTRSTTSICIFLSLTIMCTRFCKGASAAAAGSWLEATEDCRGTCHDLRVGFICCQWAVPPKTLFWKSSACVWRHREPNGAASAGLRAPCGAKLYCSSESDKIRLLIVSTELQVEKNLEIVRLDLCGGLNLMLSRGKSGVTSLPKITN